MLVDTNPLQELAWRVRRGEPGAAEKFRREMSLALEGMVRLALRKRTCFNPFEEQARAQADQLQDQSGGQLAPEQLVRETARRVCQDMMRRLQAGGRILDTVACAGSRTQQTVARSAWSGVGGNWPSFAGP